MCPISDKRFHSKYCAKSQLICAYTINDTFDSFSRCYCEWICIYFRPYFIRDLLNYFHYFELPLWQFQKDMHLCSAKCCDDSSSSMDVVQGCIDRCSQPVNRAQQYVQKELGEYQGRLQRCVMVSNNILWCVYHTYKIGNRLIHEGHTFFCIYSQFLVILSFLFVSLQQCNDDIKLEISPNPSEDEIAKFTAKFERCAVKCVDTNIALLPKLFSTMKSVLNKGPQNIPK